MHGNVYANYAIYAKASQISGWRGGSLTKMPFILLGTIAALSSSLWPLNSWNTKGLCHFQPQEVSQPSHFFGENEPGGSSSKPLPSYGNVHEFSMFEIDSAKPLQMTSFQAHQRFPSLRCPAGAGCDPGMTSNEVGGTAGTAGTAAASPFLVDASAGAGASIFETANPIRDLITIDYQDTNCCVWKFDCSKFVAIAPWHPTIDLAFARVSLSACALAALAACSTSHAMSSPCWSASLSIRPVASSATQNPARSTDDKHQPVACKNCSSSAFCSLSACCCSSRAACRSACLWACCFAWSSYSRLAPLNLVEQGVWHLTTIAVFIEQFLYVM